MFDVDGVLTNGDVLLTNNDFCRTFNSKDAYAIQYACKLGYKIFIITGGSSLEVKNRLLDLDVTEVFLKSSNKKAIYDAIKIEHNIQDSEVLYMGDDIPDYAVMCEVALAACPQDACQEIKSISHYHSPILGGKGCVRDVIEQTLKVQGNWFKEGSLVW